MIPIYSAEAVRNLDRAAIDDAGIPGIELMRRAARALLQSLQRHWPDAGVVTVFCGSGNNAGDGYLLATLLHELRRPVRIVAVGDPQRLRGDAAEAHRMALAAGVAIRPFSACEMPERGVLVDAMLGTGLAGPVREPYLSAIGQINATGLPVLAVDVPSGLGADTGAILGAAVHATRTVTLVGRKAGLYTGDGRHCAGEIEFDDLGVPGDSSTAVAHLLERSSLMRGFPARHGNAHKGSCGHLCIIAGARGMGGAGVIAALGAARSGCGLVTLATAADNPGAANSAVPEVIARPVETAAELFPLPPTVDVVAIGPGLGTSDWSASLLRGAIDSGKPLVVDADALNLLATGFDWPADGRPDAVLTPHPGEAARLLGCTSADVQADRFGAVRALQARFQTNVVLKGAGTLVIDIDGGIGICAAGNPGMATAGMGDLLTGLIGSLCAQGMAVANAARLGVVLHALAGDLAAAEGARGMLATDLLPHLRTLVNERV